MDALKSGKDWDSNTGTAANNAPVGAAGQPGSKSPFNSAKAFAAAGGKTKGKVSKGAIARRMAEMKSKSGKTN